VTAATPASQVRDAALRARPVPRASGNDRWLLMRLLGAAGATPTLADRLLAERDSLGAILQLPPERLAQLGLPGEAMSLVGLIRDILSALLQPSGPMRPRIGSSADLVARLFPDMAWRETEEVRAAFLDSGQHLIRVERLGSGSVDCAPVYPREIARRALELAASSAILVHNHPSGDPTPSPADREISRRVAAALAAIDIRLLDHVIIARNGWASAGGDISSVHISTGKGCAPRAMGAK
jgi:DNA repair protein RadC